MFRYVATALREGLRTFASAASITTLRPGVLTLPVRPVVALMERSLGLVAMTRSTRSGDSVKVFSLGADTLDAFWAVSTLGSPPLYDEVTLAMMAGSQSVLLRSMAQATTTSLRAKAIAAFFLRVFCLPWIRSYTAFARLELLWNQEVGTLDALLKEHGQV